jgi:hypothetical protein
MSPEPIGLPALEARLAEALDHLAYPAADWVRPLAGAEALDCAIIGGGQYGLAVAAGLRRERITRLAIFDEGPAGPRDPGPAMPAWRRCARPST